MHPAGHHHLIKGGQDGWVAGSCPGRRGLEGCHARQQEVPPREGHQVGGDLVDIHVQGALEAHGGCEVQQQLGGQGIHAVKRPSGAALSSLPAPASEAYSSTK